MFFNVFGCFFVWKFWMSLLWYATMLCKKMSHCRWRQLQMNWLSTGRPDLSRFRQAVPISQESLAIWYYMTVEALRMESSRRKKWSKIPLLILITHKNHVASSVQRAWMQRQDDRSQWFDSTIQPHWLPPADAKLCVSVILGKLIASIIYSKLSNI